MRKKNIHSLGHRLTRWRRKKYIALTDKLTHRTQRKAAEQEVRRLGGVAEGLGQLLANSQAELTQAQRLAPIVEEQRKQLAAKDRRIKALDQEVLTTSPQLYADGLRQESREVDLFVDNSGTIWYQSPAATKLLGPQASLRDIVYARELNDPGQQPLSVDQVKDQIVSSVIRTDYNPDSRNKSGILLVTKGKKPMYPVEITNRHYDIERGVQVGTEIKIVASGWLIGKKYMGETATFQQETATRIRTTGQAPETA